MKLGTGGESFKNSTGLGRFGGGGKDFYKILRIYKNSTGLEREEWRLGATTSTKV